MVSLELGNKEDIYKVIGSYQRTLEGDVGKGLS